MKPGSVYITSNKNRTVLYTGSSSFLPGRMYKHKKGVYQGFAKRYNCTDLLYYEDFNNIADAAKKEKQIKKWNREWKWELIRKMNPDLKDLSKDWFDANGNLISELPEFDE